MTVTTTDNKITYTANGNTAVFAYNFPVLELSHLFVYLDGVLQQTGFTVTGIGETNGGDVTFDANPADLVQVIIHRLVPLTQLIDYVPFDKFPAEVNEEGLDLGVMRDQQIAEGDGRSLRVPITDPPIKNVPTVSERAGRLLAFDAFGDPVPGALLSGTVTELDDLTDVEITEPEETNEILVFNATTGKYENKKVAEVELVALDDLSDVEVPTPVDNDALIYETDKWVNKLPVLALDELTDVLVPAPADNQILTWQTNQWVAQDLPENLSFIGNFDPVTGVPALQDVAGGGVGGPYTAGDYYFATDTGLYNFTTATPGSGTQVNINDQVVWSDLNTNWVVLATGQTTAAQVSYDNSTSGLPGANVQDAIDGLDANVDVHETRLDGVDTELLRLDDVKIEDTLPAIQAILTTNSSYIDIAFWHPSLDAYPEWYDGVTGARSTFMAVTFRDPAPDPIMDVWDMTVDPPVLLQSETMPSGVTPTSVDILGGMVVISGYGFIALQRFQWTAGGFVKLPNLHTSSVPAIPSNNVDHVKLGYTRQPTMNPATGSAQPSIAYLAGNFPGVIRDDGFGFHSLTNNLTTSLNKVAWMSGNILINQDTAANRIFYSSDPQTMTGNVDADWFTDIFARGGTQAALETTVASTNGHLAVVGQLAARAGTSGGQSAVDVFRISSLPAGSVAQNAFGLSALIATVNYSGWRPVQIRGTWLTSDGITDRSGRVNTLTENGTVPSQAVALGAETQSYGPYSAANYFSRAFDADFDPGTGDLVVACWFKTAPNAVNQRFVDRRDPGLTGALYTVVMRSADGAVGFQVDDDVAPAFIVYSSTGWDDGLWHQFVGVWDGAADTIRLYIDGALNNSNSQAGIGTLSNGLAQVFVGISADLSSPSLDTELALVRIAMVAPTADEIRYMYETEKRMFDDNALVTLGGAGSIAAAGAAIDPVNGDIHIGQVNGLNRLNGLVREDFRLVADPELWTSDVIEHVAAVAGGVAIVTDTEAYAEVPAIEVRDSLNKLVEAQNVSGPDLSKAKAWGWIENNGAAVLISNSYNIKSVTDNSAGDVTVTLATPFADARYSILCTPNANTAAQPVMTVKLQDAGSFTTLVYKAFDNTLLDVPFMFACFGQLEGE